MQAERWQEIDRLFDAALERAPAERAAFLDAACAGDDDLRREVESLLAASERAGTFIEAPAMEVAAKASAGAVAEAFAAPGREIGPYRVLSLLGAGGMGEVYLAEDTRLGRRVALKLLPAEFAHDAERVRRFEREARAASALNHPNIVTIYEMGQSGGAYFIATELVEGRTLRGFMPHARAQMKEALSIMAQVADALAAAHTARIVHRDIKPENVMVRPDGYVKVLDFGLAKLTEPASAHDASQEWAETARTDTGAVLGTIAYMSPEQALGERVDHRTDIFSLGVVLYEMAAGKHPFKGPTAAATFDALLNREPPAPANSNPDVAPELERIIGRALEKDRELRYQTASDLRAELRRWQRTLDSSLTASARTDARMSHRPRVISRPRIALAGLALAALLVVTAAVFVVSRRLPPQEVTAPILSAPFRSEKFSTSGKVFHAALSPDGTLAAYTDESGGKYSIWLRRLETADNVQLVPPSDEFYYGLVFTHDGRSIFFVRGLRDERAQSAVYRVSVFGGLPEKILERTEGWISLSPDDRQLSFVRCEHRSDDYCSLLTADVDGKNERKILTRPEPIRISDNQFSPDGKSIAFAVGQSSDGGSDFHLRRVELTSGAESQLSPKTFFNILSLKWLPGGDDLLVAAIENRPLGGLKIWRVSTTTGEAEPLTKDAESYSIISLDERANKMIATQVSNDFHLYFSTDGGTRMLARARTVTFAPGGKIIYEAPDGDIWTISRDGGEQRQLTNNAFGDSLPRVSPDGRFIFFTSNRSGTDQVWRMNADGSNQRQLTNREGGRPRFVTPDGKWVYYENGLRRRLWKVAAEGGEEIQVWDGEMYSPAFTPDGHLVAYVFRDGGAKIGVLSLTDNQLLKVYTPAGEKSWPVLAWSGDNRTLNYVTNDNTKNSLWQQTLDEDRPRFVADLGDKQIQDFAVAPGGDGFAYVRGEWLHNAVLISGLN